MAKWKLSFRVDIERVCKQRYRDNSSERDKVFIDHTNRILRGIAKLDPRPVRAVVDQGCAKLGFIIDAESQSHAHGQQSRIHDSLSKAIDEAKLGEEYAIEFDAPQEVEAGAKDQ